MVRLLLSSALLSPAAALAACTPSPQENAMHTESPESGKNATASIGTGSEGEAAGAASRGGPGAGNQERAAVGPIPEPVPVAEHSPTGLRADSPAEAEGRRTLSTAFVRVGPDGHLTVELRGGRVLVLRNVEMRRRDYCGEQVSGGKAGGRYCGGYAEVAAARAGGAPAP